MRQIINFNSEWLYYPRDEFDFDEQSAEKVCVPHANTILTEHKGKDGSFQKQIESYRFVSQYKKHFTLPCDYSDRKIFVEFEGVATICQVYVNGNFAGEHKGAYTGFKFDITDFVLFGEDNVMQVRCDSTKHTDVPPEGKDVDYCLFGGIVRNVNLIVTNEIFIKNVFVTTSDVSSYEATVKVDARLNKKAEIITTIFDGEDDVVARGSNELKIENPHLWSVDDPYLYTLRVMAAGFDTYEVKIGIRTVEFKESGIMLNGDKIKLMGINRHEQWPYIGRAVPDKLQKRDADMIKDSGFNAVRCSHYPQSPAFLDRCDEIGLLVFEEAPGWQHIGDESWQQLYIDNIREMIERDFNHPSIISWGVRVNESNDNDAFYKKTNEFARSIDPTRPTHGARREDTYKTSAYYEDIYTAHYVYPQEPVHTPFLVTEHSWDCWGNGYGYIGASDEQALAFTKDFADKANYYFGNKLCAGGFAWSMFDYNNEVNYTRTENVFYSGIYDIFRHPKMVANLYKSQKDPKKHGGNIYIANYWDDDSKPLIVKAVSGDIAQGKDAGGGVCEGEAFSVTVMSNCERVELFVNGEKIDKDPVRQFANLPHPFFVFENIEYVPGEITAVGYIDGCEAARYVQKTPLKPSKLILVPDYETLIPDGTDMTQVSVMLVDENGTVLPTADNEIEIEVSGAGEFIGEKKIKLEGGKCAFIVKSRYKESGDIICTASANDIEKGICSIRVLKECE